MIKNFIALRPSWLFALALLASCGTAFDAHAQAMDYGALQSTFGEPVTTSATGSPQRATDAPVDMIIVTADDIRRSGAHDIPGVLRHVAGIDVDQWTADDADVSVRGYNQPYSPRLLVLIDGRQVYADFYGFTPWSTLPVELAAIRQIEIVKGPSTALFGFNAVGGVINIITYNPLYDDINSVSIAAGSQGFGEGTAVLTLHRDDRFALMAQAGGRLDDEFTSPIPANVIGTPRRKNYRGEVSLNGIVQLSDNIQLSLEASHSIAAQNEFFLSYSLDTAQYQTDSLKAQLSDDGEFGLLSVTAYTNWISEKASFVGLGGILAPRLQNQVSVAQAQYSFTLGAGNTVRLAGEYRHNTAETAPVSGGDIAYDVYSGSAMWAWSIVPSLSLTNAVRLDDLSLGRSGSVPAGYPFVNADWKHSIAETSFNSGVTWRADDDNTLRLTASRGVQLPNLTNLGSLLLVYSSLAVTGSPDLDPTAVWNYEASWDRTLDDIGGKLQASVFHQETKGIISVAGTLITTSSGVWIAPAEVGNSSANGAELSLSGSTDDGWRWGGSYRFEKVRDDFLPFAQHGMDYVEFARSTPRHLVNLNLGWADDTWEIDGYLRYQSRTIGLVDGPLQGLTLETPISDYVSFDGRVGYRLSDHVAVALSGQNLALSRQRQTTAPDVQRRVLLTLTTAL